MDVQLSIQIHSCGVDLWLEVPEVLKAANRSGVCKKVTARVANVAVTLFLDQYVSVLASPI